MEYTHGVGVKLAPLMAEEHAWGCEPSGVSCQQLVKRIVFTQLWQKVILCSRPFFWPC